MSAVDALIRQLNEYALEREAQDASRAKRPTGHRGKVTPSRAPSAAQSSTSIANKASRGEGPSRSRSDAQDVSDELLALGSIYGDDSIALLPTSGIANDGDEGGHVSRDKGSIPDAAASWQPSDEIHISIRVPLDAQDGQDDTLKLEASFYVALPPDYPSGTAKPELRLLSRFVGAHSVDDVLARQISQICQSAEETGSEPTLADEHVAFIPGQVALFDGLDKARELVESWYTSKEAERLQRDEEREISSKTSHMAAEAEIEGQMAAASVQDDFSAADGLEGGVELVSAPALSERKSTFVGHAARITHPDQVAPTLAALVANDRRIARATHPAIYAWVCKTQTENGATTMHRDCDDDGETAAGGRLAHLLELLHLEDVLVVVTRWYGGVQLGPDRFKLINRAARDALEVLGAVEGPLNQASSQHGSKMSQEKRSKGNSKK